MSTSSISSNSRLLRLLSSNCCCRQAQVRRSYSSFKSVASFSVPGSSSKPASLIPQTPAVTRFAPSPTGFLHLGSLRTALYSYLLAKRTGGTFILRLEDTDVARTVPGAEERLYEDLSWAGILWDEGPDRPGPNGPYRQSERLGHYHSVAQRMLANGTAYRCFCSSKSLDDLKQQSLDAGSGSVRYPGTCRSIPAGVSDSRAAAGEPHAVRFRPSEARVAFHDLVYGRYARQEDEEDFVLVKTDGFPTYHFANVVDDHLMKITHVIRGVEWLISTPKHIALYKALGWAPPAFAHAPLLAAPGGAKLSKRDGSIDIAAYRDALLLPSALNNWAAILGCQMRKGDNSEVFLDMQELVDNFSLKFTKGNVTINPQKMAAFQSAHVRAALSGDPKIAARTLLQPLLSKIASLDAIRQAAGDVETPIPLAKADPRTLSSSSLGPLVPALRGVSPGAGQQSAPALSYLRRVLSADETRHPDGVTLLLDHPHLFWRVPAAVHARGLLGLFADTFSPGVDAPTCALVLDRLVGEIDVPANDWTPDSLAAVLNTAVSAAVSAVSAPPSAEEKLNLKGGGRGGGTRSISPKEVWGILRLAMVGSASTPTKPAKVLLSLLGRDEVLRRFEVLRRVIDQQTK